jgi:hypothetical protein
MDAADRYMKEGEKRELAKACTTETGHVLFLDAAACRREMAREADHEVA